tara:strand:+ start:1583 stop:2335 length:753 start_codon:yes stop_codon:yes gene_type:complete
MQKLLFILICLFFFTNVIGEDLPYSSTLYHQTENSSLTYNCQKKGDFLECSFNQLSIWGKSTEDIIESNERIKKLWKDDKGFSKKTCSEFKEFQNSLRGKSDKNQNQISNMSEYAKTNSLKYLDVAIKHCKRPTLKTFEELIKLGNEEDKKTCIINSQSYTQKFQKIPQTKKWVVVPETREYCGVINVSRFEPDEGSKRFEKWKYIAEKKVLNKDNKDIIDCSMLDEKPYVYSGSFRSFTKSCEFFKFRH